MLAYEFKAFKNHPLVSALALRMFTLRTRGLEKLVFTATTGRSGTLTLAKIFSAVPGCAAVHEAHPVMNGPVLAAASYGDQALVDEVYRRVKAVNIRRAAIGHRYYMEANHLFIKTFARNALEDFDGRLAVIHLVRPAVEVASSIYRLDDCPGSEMGNKWWLDHRAPTNLLAIAGILDSDAEFAHPFYRALWYWHEVEARIAQWRARFPTVQCIRFETQWLNDANKVCELLDGLGIPYERPLIEAKVGLKEHTKDHIKTGVVLAAGQAREMAARFSALLERLELPRR
jgi:hypothetical protein